MATQTRNRLAERPLNVVLGPESEAEAAYRSTVLAPGFVAEPGLDLKYLGGRTLPALTFTIVYLGRWDAAERAKIDASLSAAMADHDLNNVIAQYFPNETVTSTFAGSEVHGGPTPPRVDQATAESIVRGLSVEGVACICLPRGTVLADDSSDSHHGLGGYHGSVDGKYYAAAVYSDGDNGIVAFDEPWKNVCATLYHELQETRTDPDVEDAVRAGATPAGEKLLGWYSPRGGEIGDIPLAVTHDIASVFREVPLTDRSGTVPVQLMWSNAVGGPEGPIRRPHRAM